MDFSNQNLKREILFLVYYTRVCWSMFIISGDHYIFVIHTCPVVNTCPTRTCDLVHFPSRNLFKIPHLLLLEILKLFPTKQYTKKWTTSRQYLVKLFMTSEIPSDSTFNHAICMFLLETFGGNREVSPRKHPRWFNCCLPRRQTSENIMSGEESGWDRGDASFLRHRLCIRAAELPADCNRFSRIDNVATSALRSRVDFCTCDFLQFAPGNNIIIIKFNERA